MAEREKTGRDRRRSGGRSNTPQTEAVQNRGRGRQQASPGNQPERPSASLRQETGPAEIPGSPQSERTSLRGPQPNRTVGEGLRSNAFGLRDGTQVVSASDGFQQTSFEPTTGRRIVTGEDGLARFESRIVGGDREQRPSLRRGGIPDAGGRELNTTLASGIGEHGEPVFDNASIERGIESGVIPDPGAEEERIARNRLQDQQNLLHPSRRELEVEANNPAQAEVNATRRQSLLDAQAERERSQAIAAGRQQRGPRVSMNTPLSELGGRSRQDIGKETQGAVGAALRSAGIEVEEGEDVGGALSNFIGTSVQNAHNMPGITDIQDMIDLYAVARSMPDAATGGSSDSEPLDAAATLEILQEAALRPEKRAWFRGGDRVSAGSDQFRMRKFQGRARSGMERIMQNYRQDVESRAIGALAESGELPAGSFNQHERRFAEETIRGQGRAIAGVPDIEQEIEALRDQQRGLARAGQAGDRSSARAAQAERSRKIQELEEKKQAEEERVNNRSLQELAAEIQAQRTAQRAAEEMRNL